MEKTAVQILIDTITNFPELVTKEWILGQCEEVKYEEKKQIKDAVVWFDNTHRRHNEIEKEVEEYYNSRYGDIGMGSEQFVCKNHPNANTYTSITGALCCVECFEVIWKKDGNI